MRLINSIEMNYKVKILLTWFVVISIVLTAYMLLSPKSEKTDLANAESEYTSKINEANAKQAEIDSQLKNLQ
jgi:cell division protein FtsL